MLTGSCLCGTVRFQVRGELGTIVHCHCVDCRKAARPYTATARPSRIRSEYASAPWTPTQGVVRPSQLGRPEGSLV